MNNFDSIEEDIAELLQKHFWDDPDSGLIEQAKRFTISERREFMRQCEHIQKRLNQLSAVIPTKIELEHSKEEKNLVLELSDQDAFVASVKQIVWELDSSKIGLLLEVINNSHHRF